MWVDGLRLALTTFTVAPGAPPRRIDRAAAGWAMRFAPPVGAVLGLVLAGFLYAARFIGLPGLLAAALTVGLAALLSRGLHLDGLADTADALGAYSSPQRALEIMKSPEVGPFGVAAVVMALLLQTVAITFLAVPALVAAFAMGRLAAAFGCRSRLPAARPGGLGALVAGTVGPAALALNTAFVIALAIWAVPGRPWQGPLAVLAAVAVTLALSRHAVHRFGGVTGDVLGFLAEIATTLTLVAMCVGASPS